MPIKDLARGEVVTTSADAPVAELASIMKDEDVGSVVITEGDEPAGIVTDRDLTMRVLADGIDPSESTAGDVMSETLHTVEEGAGFYEVAERMSEHAIRRLPVCDADGALVGIITADDMTELLADELQQLAAVIEAQRPPY